MNSLFARTYIWLSAMIFLTVLVMGVSFITMSGNYISAEMMAQLSHTAQRTARAASSYIAEYGGLGAPYRVLINVVTSTQGSHILVADQQGVIVMCSDDPFCDKHVGKTVPQTLTDTVLAQGAATEQSTLGGIYDAKRNVAACALTDASGEKYVGFVAVSTTATENRVLVNALFRICLLVALAVLLVSSISAYLVSKQLTKPLKAISQCMQKYSRGDFSTRVPVQQDSNDEIAVLCTNFNAMADSLQHLEELRRDFIANVSHELRTPMTVIAGYVDGVLDGAIPTDDAKRYLTIVTEEIRRLSRLVARMLDISQMQSGNISYNVRPVNLCELVRRVILGFENTVESKGLEVKCELPAADINVSFDPDALTQVLTNLTDNAIKFAPPGGLLSIVVTQRGHRATVAVANTGPEIPEQDLPFVFDRFHKADKSRGEDKVGLGLGLYIVRSILNSHNEGIRVTSENGVTTFSFGVSVVK